MSLRSDKHILNTSHLPGSDNDDSDDDDFLEDEISIIKQPTTPDNQSLVEVANFSEANFSGGTNTKTCAVENSGDVEVSGGSDQDSKTPTSTLFANDFEVQLSEMSALNATVINPDIAKEAEHASLLSATIDPYEPRSENEALNCNDREKWIQAMDAEVKALKQNDTWELTELPPGRKAIDNKWVFKIKRSATGEVERYKARLVIKGYSQVHGIDYDETYSPVVRYSSVRLLLALAAKFDLSIHQMDAVTAFLQGDLEEEIYMRQPNYISDGTNRVCRLKKSLYGLKQASRVWNIQLNNVLTNKLGFDRSKVDQCIYYKHSDLNTLILAVYVDDILIFGSNMTMITKLKKSLSAFFKMKDLGVATSVLGMNITRREDGSISVDQCKYILDVLERFKMTECNPVKTPMDPNQKLPKDMCPKTEEEKRKMKDVPYQEVIGCIMYASQISRPDISYAVSSLSRYNSNYGNAHWVAVKRVLRYLKATANLKLTYRKGDLVSINN